MIYAEWVFAMREATRFKSIQHLTLDQIPEKSRRVILNLMQRLNALADDPEKTVAAGALTSLCALKTLIGDDGNRTAEVRRAVELNPGNEQAWDMLIGFTLQTEAPEKFLEVCERRLQHKKSARNHLIVAKALNVQKRFQEAEEQARASLKLDENYAPASLMLAALAIRQNLHGAATAFLLQARKAIEQLTDDDEANQRKREAFLNLAIVFALQDEPMKAREILESLLQRDETDQTARAIMTALP
jgi:tetratricopeptide (TPR) repeat protein